jgi:1-acyl-sn-glycerol-3-phosphate acyltransferase
VLLSTITFPIIFIGLTFFSRSERVLYWMHRLPEAMARLVIRLWGIRVEEVNKDRIPVERQCVFSTNHRSYLDALLVGGFIPNFKKFLGKAEILNYPFLGYLLRKLYVPVQRDDREHRRWSMEAMKEKLKTGASMVILPEGTCNTTNDLLKHFHDGAFRLAVYAQIPLVVGTIINAGELMPRSLRYISPGKVRIYWEEPIETEGLTEEDVPALKEKVANLMLVHLRKHYPNGYFDAPQNKSKKVNTKW